MPKILLLTCQDLPHEDHETLLFARALSDRGVASVTLAWTDPEVRQVEADLTIIRTTWDYTHHLPEFLAMLSGLQSPVLNPISIVTWNSHKGYLTQLAAAGVPVVPTVLVPAGTIEAVPTVDAAEVIIKPAVSAGAKGVGRFPVGSAAALDHLAALISQTDALVQPFVPDVVDGERSLMYLGGVYSHAVRKVPAAGDFRVQAQHGGVSRPHIATGAEIEVAESALREVPGGSDQLLYARVDLVGSGADPKVMELELIEPELFLPHAPGSADRLAQAAIARL